LNLYIAFDSIGIFTILILATHEHRRYFHLVVSSVFHSVHYRGSLHSQFSLFLFFSFSFLKAIVNEIQNILLTKQHLLIPFFLPVSCNRKSNLSLQFAFITCKCDIPFIPGFYTCLISFCTRLISLSIIFFWWWYWSLNAGLCACQASTYA
jgi:hypothetical protein